MGIRQDSVGNLLLAVEEYLCDGFPVDPHQQRLSDDLVRQDRVLQIDGEAFKVGPVLYGEFEAVGLTATDIEHLREAYASRAHRHGINLVRQKVHHQR